MVNGEDCFRMWGYVRWDVDLGSDYYLVIVYFKFKLMKIVFKSSWKRFDIGK